MSAFGRGTFVAVLAAAGACDDVDLPSDLRWESEHFVYQARAGEDVACPDVVQGLEEHFEVMQTRLGFDWPAGQKVTYYKFLSGEDLHEHGHCGDAAGCAPGAGVESSWAADTHELVHAYLWTVGYPPWLLVEGAAIALACETPLFAAPTRPWRDIFVEGVRRNADLYGAGGWLAGFLLEHRPVASFLALYKEAGHDQSAAEFAATFERVYGESLDDVWAAATASALPPASCPWECSRPAAPLDGTTLVPTQTTCGFAPVHSVALAQPTELVAKLTGGSGFGVFACGDGSRPPPVYVAGQAPASFTDYTLAAGHYFVVGPSGRAALTLDAHPAGTYVGPICSAAPPPWQDLSGTLAVFVPAGEWQVPLDWAAKARVVAFPVEAPSETSVCESPCGGAAGCVRSLPAAPFNVDVAGSRTWRLSAAAPNPGADLTVFALTATP